MTKDEYKEKLEILKKWAYAYYVQDNPIATDEEYDALYRDIEAYERQNPKLADESSPTKRVGGVVRDGFSKATHKARMWSMEDIFDKDGLVAWVERMSQECKAMEDTERFYKQVLANCDEIAMIMDGVVIKVDNIEIKKVIKCSTCNSELFDGVLV